MCSCVLQIHEIWSVFLPFLICLGERALLVSWDQEGVHWCHHHTGIGHAHCQWKVYAGQRCLCFGEFDQSWSVHRWNYFLFPVMLAFWHVRHIPQRSTGLCVCVCVHACVRACVYACAHVFNECVYAKAIKKDLIYYTVQSKFIIYNKCIKWKFDSLFM